MSAIAKRHWPPALSPSQSEAVLARRAAYSDRSSALMALFCPAQIISNEFADYSTAVTRRRISLLALMPSGVRCWRGTGKL
jgi:hypothetical protein